MFRAFQIGNQRLKERLAGRVIRSPGLVINGKACEFLQIPDLGYAMRQKFFGLFIAVLRQMIERPDMPFNRVDGLFKAAGRCLEGEEQIQRAAEQGEHQNQKDPCELVCALVLLGDDIQRDEETEARQQMIETLGDGAAGQDEMNKE